MGWIFRKSINMGPLRWNLSRRGLGWSVGRKGLRYSQGASGRRYVTIGAGGLYYRHPIGGPPAQTGRQTASPTTLHPALAPAPAPSTSTKPVPSAPPVQRAPMTAQEVADLITEAQQPFRWDFTAAVAAAVIALAALVQGGIGAGIVTAVVGGVIAIVVRQVERHRRAVVIDCSGLSAAERSTAIRIHGPVRCMGTVQGLWAMPPIAPGTTSTDVDTRAIASVGDNEPPWVVTDINTPNIVCRHWHACFLPHGLLLLINGHATVTPYRDLHISGLEVLVDDTLPPPEADVVTPGRCRYGQVTITTPAMSVRLILSRVDVAKQCVGDLVAAIKDMRAIAP